MVRSVFSVQLTPVAFFGVRRTCESVDWKLLSLSKSVCKDHDSSKFPHQSDDSVVRLVP